MIHRNTHAPLLALLVAAASAQGCLTRALWYEPEVTPPIEIASVPCAVRAVTVPAEGGGNAIGVTFTVPVADGVPEHLRRYAEDPGFVELSPRSEAGGDWRKLPGASLFAPTSFDLRVTGGSYFRRAASNARLTFHGTLAPEEVGELLTTEELPPALRDLNADLRDAPAPTSASDRRLAAFGLHRWAELLPSQPLEVAFRATPVAWVDQHLRLADPGLPPFGTLEQVERARRERSRQRLLGRLDGEYGEVLWVLIPAAVLEQGSDLALRRAGAVVRWSREQIWSGRLAHEPPDAAARLPYPLPLRGGVFEYRYAREIEESKLVFSVFKVIATPVTAVLDLAIMTNPYLANLLDLFRDRPIEPIDEGQKK